MIAVSLSFYLVVLERNLVSFNGKEKKEGVLCDRAQQESA